MMIGGLPRTLIGWGLAALVLLSFALLWGYFVYFEGLRDGQTPGKRKLRIRVTHDGGYPLSLRGAMVRNLLRVVDIQPVPSWLVGGTVMLFHPQTKRLGDLAAGSVVVRERRVAQLPEESAGVPGAAGPPRLADEEFRALSGYIARRGDLKGEVRSRISGGLAARLADHAGWNPQRESADVYLVALHRDEAARRAAAGSAGVAGSAQATALVRRQRERWEELRRLVDRAGQRGLHQLSEEEVARFATLYRETSADLARARTYGGSPDLVYTLERLVGLGHNLLYRPTGRSWKTFRHWLVAGFPATVRRRWAPIAIAAALLYGPALFAFVAIRLDPSSAREFLPAGMIVRAEEGSGAGGAGAGICRDPPRLHARDGDGNHRQQRAGHLCGVRGRDLCGTRDRAGAGLQRRLFGRGFRAVRQPRLGPLPLVLRAPPRSDRADGDLHRRGSGTVDGIGPSASRPIDPARRTSATGTGGGVADRGDDGAAAGSRIDRGIHLPRPDPPRRQAALRRVLCRGARAVSARGGTRGRFGAPGERRPRGRTKGPNQFLRSFGAGGCIWVGAESPRGHSTRNQARPISSRTSTVIAAMVAPRRSSPQSRRSGVCERCGAFEGFIGIIPPSARDFRAVFRGRSE